MTFLGFYLCCSTRCAWFKKCIICAKTISFISNYILHSISSSSIIALNWCRHWSPLYLLHWAGKNDPMFRLLRCSGSSPIYPRHRSQPPPPPPPSSDLPTGTQPSDAHSPNGAQLIRTRIMIIRHSRLSPLSGRLCRDVTPATRFLYPIQYNAILLKVTEV